MAVAEARLPGTVVVFGASGFIGRNLVDRLVSLGIRVFSVNASGRPVQGCELTVSVDRLEELPDLPSETGVVNMAAQRYEAGRFETSQSDILRTNSAVSSAIYGFCLARRLTEVRLASSVAVYPAAADRMDDEQPVDLNGWPHEGEAFYAWSKRWAEVCAGLYHRRYGINTIAFRLSNPYGPYDSTDVDQAHVVPAFVMRALSHEPEFVIKGNAAAERDFVYVGDVVEAFVQSLALRGRQEACNLAFGSTVSVAGLARAALAAAGASKPLVVSEAPAAGVFRRRPTAVKIRQLLDLPPFRSLEEGLIPTVAWYRDVLGR